MLQEDVVADVVARGAEQVLFPEPFGVLDPWRRTLPHSASLWRAKRARFGSRAGRSAPNRCLEIDSATSLNSSIASPPLFSTCPVAHSNTSRTPPPGASSIARTRERVTQQS